MEEGRQIEGTGGGEKDQRKEKLVNRASFENSRTNNYHIATVNVQTLGENHGITVLMPNIHV